MTYSFPKACRSGSATERAHTPLTRAWIAALQMQGTNHRPPLHLPSASGNVIGTCAFADASAFGGGSSGSGTPRVPGGTLVGTPSNCVCQRRMGQARGVAVTRSR
jgi:hypothetical protein